MQEISKTCIQKRRLENSLVSQIASGNNVSAFECEQFANKFLPNTVMWRHRTTTSQEDNVPGLFDTVEVIGSIPVAHLFKQLTRHNSRWSDSNSSNAFSDVMRTNCSLFLFRDSSRVKVLCDDTDAGHFSGLRLYGK